MTKLVVLAIPLLLLLAGCDPTPPAPTASPTVKPVKTSVPTEEPAEVPVADDYLVEYAPADTVAESFEIFHYAFWTDDSKTVRCDVHVGGQSDPFAGCFLMPGVTPTYALPSETSLDCAVYGVDGYEVGLIAIPADGGYGLPRAQVSGCADFRDYPSAAIAADTLVLAPGAALDFGPFRCSVADAVATCEYPDIAASVSLGIGRIAVVN